MAEIETDIDNFLGPPDTAGLDPAAADGFVIVDKFGTPRTSAASFESGPDIRIAAPGGRGDGLRVELRKVPHVTKRGLLQQPFRMQCPPLDTFRVDTEEAHIDYDTIQNGQFSRDGGRVLAVVTFSTLVTIAPEPWVITDGLYDHKDTSGILRDIEHAGTAVRMVAWHPGRRAGGQAYHAVDINMKCTLRTVGIEERAGEGDARYYDVSFTEWRDPVTLRKRRKGHHNWPIRVHIDANDTLAALARRFYGKPSMGHLIGDHNDNLHGWGIQTPIAKNNHYKAGDVVKVPEPPRISTHFE